MDIRGKKAIVTGGAMGFGFATCKELLKAGCDITVWDMAEKQMEDAAAELKRMGLGKVYSYMCDVTDVKRVHELFDQAKKDMGKVDILINNAAWMRIAALVDMSIEDIVKQNEVNVNALYYTMKAVLPDMMDRNSGWIVNISSAASIFSFASAVPYTSSKWAVQGMCDALRLEMKVLGKKGVKIMSVHPGLAKGGGMFEGGHLTRFLNMLFPEVEQDLLGKRLVKGIKKGRSMVCCPRGVYVCWMMRGWIPNSVWDAQLMLLGFPGITAGITGRRGMAHSDTRKYGAKL
jgi:all-trans-retinol dehydrogenase (NAD+)